MYRRVLDIAAITVALFLPALGGAGDFGEGHAKARLVSGQVEERAYVGVRFDIEPGWHIYWKNPGGAGMATEVLWRLPDGMEAAGLEWPLPIFFFQSGGIPGYGYEESVVLASEVRWERPKHDAVIGADVSWLACKEVCVLGASSLEARWNEVERDPAFSEWLDSRPTAFNVSDAAFAVTSSGGLAEGKLVVWLRWETPPAVVEWFPEPPDGLVVSDVSVKSRGGLTRIDVSLRGMAGAAGPFDILPSVVTITDENQERRGWNLAVDLTDNNS